MMDSWRNELIRALPYARRYARALTGSQPRGDLLVAEGLRQMLSRSRDGSPSDVDARRTLYGWVTRRFDEEAGQSPPGLSHLQRQLLLLTTLEDCSLKDAARATGAAPARAEAELSTAREQLRSAASTDVLIIEDEPIIAMDIEELVQGCGHRVVGVAATEADAVRIAAETRPGLILADINLGAGGDGTHAISRIMRHHRAPVIFVTAYPERLLTGEALEPAFVITKPFEPLTLAIATYQAVTGGVSIA